MLFRSAGYDTIGFQDTFEQPEEELLGEVENPVTVTVEQINAEGEVVTGNVIEGDYITFRFSLDSEPESDVTLETSLGTVVIAAGTTYTDVTVDSRIDEFHVQGNEAVVASVSSAEGGGFDSIDFGGASATATVVDDSDVSTVSVSYLGEQEYEGESQGGAVVEGEQVTFRFSVDNAPQGDLVLTTSVGQVVIASGTLFTDATVDSRPDDNYIQGVIPTTATVTAAEGGNYESLDLSTASATVDVIDDYDPVTVDLSATPTVLEDSEGGTENVITYTATLSGGVAANDITVTLANGEVITITAGDPSGTTTTAVSDEDIYIDGTPVTNSIATAVEDNAGTAGALESLVLAADTSVSTEVDDTIDVVTVDLSATPAVLEDSEGGTENVITYTATLSGGVAANDITVTLANGEVITITAGDPSGTTTTAVSDEDIYIDGTPVTNSIATAVEDNAGTAGALESLVLAADTSVSTEVDDTIDVVTVDLSATPTVLEDSEGGTENVITYTATLSGGVAANDITVTLANGEVITITAGDPSGTTTTAVSDEDIYIDGTPVTNSIATAVEDNAGTAGALESLVLAADTSVSTEVDDTIDVVTVDLSATPTVLEDSEGGTENVITYTATLGGGVAANDITVTLANGEVITITAGDPSGTTTTAVSDEDIYIDGTPVTNSIATAVEDNAGTAGALESLVLAADTSVSTEVDDTIDVVTVDLSATPTVLEDSEGGTENVITYTATLGGGVAANDITVTLANGEVITITAGDPSGTTTTAVSDEDIYIDGTPVTNSIATAVEDNAGTAGALESLVLAADTSVSTEVDDTIDVVTVDLSATPTVLEDSEGGTENVITYTATLSGGVAANDITVTLANGEVITITAGDPSGTTTTAVSDEDIYIDGTPVTNSIATAVEDNAGTAGALESLVLAADTSVSTEVDDTIDVVTVDLSATPTVLEDSEGGTENVITYTATLSGGVAANDITVTLANGEVITITAGDPSGTTTTAVSDEDIYIDGTPVTNSIATAVEDNAGTAGALESLVLAADTSVSTEVDDTIDVVTVDLSATPTVLEDSEGGTENVITYTATLGGGVAANDITVTLANGEVITITAGDPSGTTTTAVSDEDIYIDGTPVTNSIATAVEDNAGTAGALESLVLAADTSVSTEVDDTIDVVTVDLSATPTVLEDSEGGTENVITYTATLSGGVAANDITVTLANGEVITITAGDPSGTTTTAVSDEDIYIDGTPVTNSIATAVEDNAGTAGALESLVLAADTSVSTEVDDTIDVVTVDLSATPTVLEDSEGGTENVITYTATLSGGVAANDITVTLANGEVITITAGDPSGTTTTAVSDEDIYIDGTPVTNSIATAVEDNAGTAGALEGLVLAADTSVSTEVDDTIDVVTVDLSATPTVLEDSEGGTENVITYTATLSGGVAANDITVTLANGEVITITAGDPSGTTTTAVSDEDIYIDGTPVTNSIATAVEDNAGTAGALESLVLAADTSVSTEVDDTIDVVTVDLSATPTVLEDSEGGTENVITYTATLSGGVAANDITVTLANGEVITITAGDPSGTTTTAVSDEDIYIDGTPVTNSIATAVEDNAGTAGALESLVLAADTSVSTEVDDTIDVVTVDLSATPTVLEDSEGGTENVITYTATLSGGVAANDITVTLANGEVITITAGDPSGTTTTAVSDEDIYIDGTPVTNSIATAVEDNAGTAGALESLVLAADTSVSTEVDDTIDAVAITLTATESVNVGGTITYTATVLNAPQLTPLVITLIDENDVTLGQITIGVGEFTGTFDATAPADADASYDVRIDSASGGNYEAYGITDTASTVVSAVPESSALLITNSNVNEQFVRVTIASEDGSNTTGVVEPTEVQGQEGSALMFGDDVDFVAGETYTVTMEHVSGEAVILTDLSVTDSNGNQLDIFAGNAKLESGDTGNNTNFDGYIFNVTIGDNFLTNSADYTVSEPIGYENLSGILSLDTESNTDEFVLDFSELSLNGGEDLFGDVEEINISGKGVGEDNAIYLSAQDVLDLGTGGDSDVTVTGDIGDVLNLVDFDGAGNAGTWAESSSTGDTTTYTYTGGVGVGDATVTADNDLTTVLNTTSLDDV